MSASMATVYNFWNEKKQWLQGKTKRKHFKERDVVFIHIGENIGCEQNGKGEDFLRPVLVYKKFSAQSFFGIPLTTSQKKSDFHASFSLKGKISTAILSQMRLFDSKRIAYYFGRVSNQNYQNVQKKLIELLQ
jgi:mRNA-degrading endonuclease toxin of MazEF toxin-antitoxin module